MGAKKYTARDIAHYIVDKCTKDKQPVSNLQLQKILYFVQMEYIKLTDEPLFDDCFLAWRYGPVIRSIYDEYSIYSGDRIYKRYNGLGIDYDTASKFLPTVEKYRALYPWDLVKESHKRGGAWDRAYKNGSGFGSIISLEDIRRDAYAA